MSNAFHIKARVSDLIRLGLVKVDGSLVKDECQKLIIAYLGPSIVYNWLFYTR